MTVAAYSPQTQEYRLRETDRTWASVLIRRMGHDPEIIRGPSKRREHLDVRRTIAESLRNEGWSLPRIARALGRRDHSCVWWMLRGGRRAK